MTKARNQRPEKESALKPSNISESNDWDWWRCAVAVPALAALFPLVAIFPALLRLIWFGDDWKLLSDYAEVGLASLLIQPFAENFAPLFKLIWITLTIAFC